MVFFHTNVCCLSFFSRAVFPPAVFCRLAAGVEELLFLGFTSLVSAVNVTVLSFLVDFLYADIGLLFVGTADVDGGDVSVTRMVGESVAVMRRSRISSKNLINSLLGLHATYFLGVKDMALVVASSVVYGRLFHFTLRMLLLSTHSEHCAG